MSKSSLRSLSLASVMLLFAGMALAQTDPGPRGGAAGAGGPLAGLNANESAFFTAAKARFAEVDSVFRYD